MPINKLHSTSMIRESILTMHIGIFSVWILTPDIKNKDRYSLRRIGNNFVIMNC